MAKIRMNRKYIFVMLLMLQLLLVCVTIHDVGTAQGIGLYFTLKNGSVPKLVYDLLVDFCGTLLYVAVLLVPFMLLKHHGVEALLRLATIYLAFMPRLDMAWLVHVFDGRYLFEFAFDWDNTTTLLSTFIREVIPILVILFVVYKRNGCQMKRWHKLLLMLEVPIGIGMFVLPVVSPIFFHCSYYLLVILAFDWWESAKRERALCEKVVIVLIFGILFSRGCYEMLDLMSMYQI